MTKSEHAALIRTLLSMQRRCDAIVERLDAKANLTGDEPEDMPDPATAIHCVSAALETAMDAVDDALNG